MLDRPLRRLLSPALDSTAATLARLGVAPTGLTLVGLVTALLAATAAGRAAWTWALALWLVSRVFDALDGPLARVRGRAGARGGFLDIVADFTAYGAFVVGCAIGQPDARLACLVLLCTYYVNGTAFLAFSSLVRPGRDRDALADDRALTFLGGLAEGTETIVVHALMVAVPSLMATIAWVFAAVVVVTIVQRIVVAVRLLER
ncbi:MAG: CDP-alcohol phosphatidyltransferase family protein [Actinobacteria bacterium]|nr:CDP-alcohol phosphatidyltransferase family protein [Actinomycetota bacterium]